jgi:hypothetical protein
VRMSGNVPGVDVACCIEDRNVSRVEEESDV